MAPRLPYPEDRPGLRKGQQEGCPSKLPCLSCAENPLPRQGILTHF
jgi:hypothetical protein